MDLSHAFVPGPLETYVWKDPGHPHGICPECQYAYVNGEDVEWFGYRQTVEGALEWCHEHVGKNHVVSKKYAGKI